MCYQGNDALKGVKCGERGFDFSLSTPHFPCHCPSPDNFFWFVIAPWNISVSSEVLTVKYVIILRGYSH